MAEQGTIAREDLNLVLLTDSVDEAMHHIHTYIQKNYKIKPGKRKWWLFERNNKPAKAKRKIFLIYVTLSFRTKRSGVEICYRSKRLTASSPLHIQPLLEQLLVSFPNGNIVVCNNDPVAFNELDFIKRYKVGFMYTHKVTLRQLLLETSQALQRGSILPAVVLIASHNHAAPPCKGYPPGLFSGSCIPFLQKM